VPPAPAIASKPDALGLSATAFHRERVILKQRGRRLCGLLREAMDRLFI
jgi:hypothetical protein